MEQHIKKTHPPAHPPAQAGGSAHVGGQAGGLVGGQLSTHPLFSLSSPCLYACCYDELQASLAATSALSVKIGFSARKDIRDMMFAEIRVGAMLTVRS